MKQDYKQAFTAICDEAKRVFSQAYVPYSNFPVGAAILTTKGNIFASCNVENAAFPQGTCAEAGAIAAMISAGEHEPIHIVVCGSSSDVACTPCGGCRQRLREFCSPQTPITMISESGNVILDTTMEKLLPYSFGPENLAR
ncbi:cytidine deaminase [Gluconobacter oxydans]|uniref:cytidine deaminase n=1 Tax=Gluconobacter oxydans TaxID=442 RepID=UPI0039EB002A